MPKGMGYKTGGKHPGKGASEFETPKGKGVDVGLHGAGYGTHMGPNTKEYAGPGGYGSSGKKSDSSPSKG